jgi:hypothetical protein
MHPLERIFKEELQTLSSKGTTVHNMSLNQLSYIEFLACSKMVWKVRQGEHETDFSATFSKLPFHFRVRILYQ